MMGSHLTTSIMFVFLILITMIALLVDVTMANARAQTIKFTCGRIHEHNSTTFVHNFVATMDNISDQMRNNGYGLSISGSGPDTDYGLAQCYGDLSLIDCALCYAEARTALPQCYPFTSGRIFLDGCFVRSENYSFFQEYKGPQDQSVCGNTTRKDSAFQETARRVVLQAGLDAPKNNGYARAQVSINGRTNESVYVLANCWRTLSFNACKACLENASASLFGCLPWSDGKALNTGCFMRYSDTNFLNPIPGHGPSRVIIIVAALSSSILLIIGTLVGYYFLNNRRIHKMRKGSNDAEKLVKTLNDSSLNFKYSTLEKATDSFHESNKLGQGGFGTVYKGVLADGREIAVKRLFINNKYRAGDFYNEVNIISSVDHKNLVRLLGCSCSGPESLLIYEYLPNLSLDRFIFDKNRGKALNWEKRFEIIIGMSEGLVYLHENTKSRIIHRDIKASNILLDSRLRAKIADFGLARSFQEGQSHISTAIAGTLGYMAPEYLAHGQLTEKADVYSFGVLLLEIVAGKQNNRSKTEEYSESLVSTTYRHFLHNKAEELFDPNLMLHKYHVSYIKNEVLRVIHIGLLCTQEIPSLRPSMSTVLRTLVKKDEELPFPTNPPFIDENTMVFHDVLDNTLKPARYEDDSAANVSHSSFYPR